MDGETARGRLTAADLERAIPLDPAVSVSPRFLRRARLLPIAVEPDGRLVVAMANPDDREAIAALELATGCRVIVRAAAGADLDAALDRLHGAGKSALERIVEDFDGSVPTADDDVDRLKDLASEAPVVRLVTHLFEEAVRLGASDIHIEPFADRLAVRLRVDGVLRDLPPPPARLSRAVVSRIKILASLNIAERRLPQDGRVGQVVGGRPLDMRVSTLPTVHGESVVIRLLDGAAGVRDLSTLGLGPGDEAKVRHLLAAPHGLILVTGPTGSGKTSTLYAALRRIDAATRKVLTVEDPVEYHMDGVNQVPVNPRVGLTFATALRSLVRQDPDVIMIGETRDGETADIAVHAALTGHLVLTTLHTNSAAGAITRLLDMGVEPFLLTSTVRGVIGQRLVRTLCRRCRAPGAASADTLAAWRGTGMAVPADAVFHHPVGCDACGGTGWRGRIGVFETLLMDEGLRTLTQARAGVDDLERAARRSGMTPMVADGLAKVAAGLTTIEEVRRVTDVW